MSSRFIEPQQHEPAAAIKRFFSRSDSFGCTFGLLRRTSIRFASRRSGVHQAAIFFATFGVVLALRQLWRLPVSAALSIARCSAVRS
jgi:hypothetical protein